MGEAQGCGHLLVTEKVLTHAVLGFPLWPESVLLILKKKKVKTANSLLGITYVPDTILSLVLVFTH